MLCQKGDFLHVFNRPAPPQPLHFATFLRHFEVLALTYARYEEVKESTNPLTFQAVFSPLMGGILHLLREPLPQGCSTEQYEGRKVTTTGCIYASERVAKTKGYPDDGIPLTIESRE